MTDLQKKFIELSKQYETVKLNLKELSKSLEEVMLQLPIDVYFQDPSDLTVFRIVKPSGTFIEYKQVGFERTKREGEVKGSMSVKDAEAAGFKVK